jgi:hypothetical protein
LVGKPEGKEPLERPTCRWRDVNINLIGTGWENADWINSIQVSEKWQALVKTVMNLWAS